MENKQLNKYVNKVIKQRFTKTDLKLLLDLFDEMGTRSAKREVVPDIRQGMKEGQNLKILLADLLFRTGASGDILNTSLDEMPLFINNPRDTIIAQWRLNLGK